MIGRWGVSKGKVEVEHDQPGLAKVDLRDKLNEQLRRAVALEVILSGGEEVRRPDEWWPERRISFRHDLRLVTQNLLGHCWLQLALAVDGDSRFCRCRACQRWLIVKPSGSRPARLTCSNKCRVKISYYKRLHTEGRITPAEVARRLNSDTQTVRSWLKGGKQ
jgi:hypothetical protein